MSAFETCVLSEICTLCLEEFRLREIVAVLCPVPAEGAHVFHCDCFHNGHESYNLNNRTLQVLCPICRASKSYGEVPNFVILESGLAEIEQSILPTVPPSPPPLPEQQPPPPPQQILLLPPQLIAPPAQLPLVLEPPLPEPELLPPD